MRAPRHRRDPPRRRRQHPRRRSVQRAAGILKPIDIVWLGRVDYAAARDLQERLRAAILDRSGDETILLLEHPPVVTLGRGADPAHVLVDEQALAARGIARVPTSRGGDVTWHGPGQLVAYPIARLDRGVVAHVEAMGHAVVELARPLGVDAAFRRDRVGVWVGSRKLAAMGIHVSRRVAIHGLALNVTTRADDFSIIVPCGLRDAGVVAIADLVPSPPSVASLALPLGALLARHLGRSPRERPASDFSFASGDQSLPSTIASVEWDSSVTDE